MAATVALTPDPLNGVTGAVPAWPMMLTAQVTPTPVGGGILRLNVPLVQMFEGPFATDNGSITLRPMVAVHAVDVRPKDFAVTLTVPPLDPFGTKPMLLLSVPLEVQAGGNVQV